MPLLQYYKCFKSIAHTEDYVEIKLGIGKVMKDFATQSSAKYTAAEIYCGISFLMGGDMDYYFKLLEEIHKAFLPGNDIYPNSFYKVYTLMSEWNHDTHRYGGSVGGGGGSHRNYIHLSSRQGQGKQR